MQFSRLSTFTSFLYSCRFRTHWLCYVSDRVPVLHHVHGPGSGPLPALCSLRLRLSLHGFAHLFSSGEKDTVRQITMDQITIMNPNPKCRLYWCLIEFTDWRYSRSCWYFRSLLWTSAPLTFSLVYSVCNGGGDRVVWRAYTGVIHCVFDRFRTFKIALPPQTKT